MIGYVPPHPTPKPKPPYQPQQYNSPTSVPSGTGTYSNPSSFTAPPVPSHDSSGKGTTVDTPSLDLFADNIDQLIAPVHQAREALNGVSVQPGAFYHANQMRISVNGANGDDGLKKQYYKVLTDLATGLADIRDGVRKLSAKYTTIEDANKITANDLSTDFDSSSSDFNGLITDAGGNPASTGSSSGNGTTNGNGTNGNGTNGNGNGQ
jgi:hypothetical protein